MEFDLHGNQGAPFCFEFFYQSRQRFVFNRCVRSNNTIGWLPESGFQTTHHRHDAFDAAKLLEQELAAGGFGERELSAGMNGAEVIQIMRTCGNLQERIGIGLYLQADELIEGKLNDGAHGVWMKC
jgi:hypothetical protein